MQNGVAAFLATHPSLVEVDWVDTVGALAALSPGTQYRLDSLTCSREADISSELERAAQRCATFTRLRLEEARLSGAALYSALTASNRLTTLNLTNSGQANTYRHQFK